MWRDDALVHEIALERSRIGEGCAVHHERLQHLDAHTVGEGDIAQVAAVGKRHTLDPVLVDRPFARVAPNPRSPVDRLLHAETLRVEPAGELALGHVEDHQLVSVSHQ